jgi:hypothetical protein
MSRSNKTALPPLPPVDNNMDTANNTATALNKVEDGFQRLKIKPKDMCCDFYFEPEMVTRTGAVLQYININSLGATKMIGCTRIDVCDARKIPLYLLKNRSIIRQHAVAALHNHFADTQCSTGVTEQLIVDDYSVSFSWASLTERGARLNPNGNEELPLGFADFDNFVEAAATHKASNSREVLVVNVFVMLQEPTRRKGATLRRAKEDEERRIENLNKPRFVRQPGNDYKRPAAITPPPMHAPEPMITAAQYPYLPPGGNPEWIKTGRTPLPAE